MGEREEGGGEGPKMSLSLSSDGVKETGRETSSCSGRGKRGVGGVGFFRGLAYRSKGSFSIV